MTRLNAQPILCALTRSYDSAAIEAGTLPAGRSVEPWTPQGACASELGARARTEDYRHAARSPKVCAVCGAKFRSLPFDHLAGKKMRKSGAIIWRREQYTIKLGHEPSINRSALFVEEFPGPHPQQRSGCIAGRAYLLAWPDDEAQSCRGHFGPHYQSTSGSGNTTPATSVSEAGQGELLKMKSLGDNWLTAIYRQTIKGRMDTDRRRGPFYGPHG